MILVTGGTGLVGSHLLFKLTKNDQNIRALYRSNEYIKKVIKDQDGSQQLMWKF